MISFALRYLWSFVSPWAGRLITWLAPGLIPWLPSLSLGKITRGLATLAVFCAVGFAAWWFTRSSPDQGPMVSVSVVEAQRLKAENKSLKASVAKAEKTLSERERESELASQYIATLEREKESLRALSSNPDAPVFPADDPWMRQGR